MKIAILGLWHLGCVYAACIASFGHKVKAFDEDAERIEKLKKGVPPIAEPDLNNLIKEGLQSGCLSFFDGLKQALKDCGIIWITYDTPVDDEDEADCAFVFERIIKAIEAADENAVFVISSQLPAGSIYDLEKLAAQKGRGDLSFVCQPENLRLGKSIEIFKNPDRVICGVRDERAKEKMKNLFSFCADRIEFMSPESAEMTKHSINAYLAMSVSFANEIAVLCEAAGADAKEVERGLKTEKRIGKDAYLRPGSAFDGGTLARDLKFLSQLSEKQSILFPAIFASNSRHKLWIFNKLKEIFISLKNKKIALWGLSYKAGSDTLRRSLAVEIAHLLQKEGADIFACDILIKELPVNLKTIISLCENPQESVKGADALVVFRQEPEFEKTDGRRIIEAMRSPVIIDANRFLFSKFAGISRYYAVGLGGKKNEGQIDGGDK
ncbi:MAG: nucleotide sugar dehydrogenase [Elusimicrobiota bacterium]|jgi:UDPglucose 6-dehydrogenase|nr:nucleotide sugar dehydrogenase [Elusimicrobiota bacterium]